MKPIRIFYVMHKKIIEKFKHLIQPEDYKLIPLTKGKFAKVDNEDFDRVKDINWCYNSSNYSINLKIGLMHRFIMNCPINKVVDHINGDGLDNRKSNLRICTQKDNLKNQKTKNKYKGVYKKTYKNCDKWMSQIRLNGKDIYIGLYSSEKEAAIAYNKKAIELFGEFANLNKID